MHLALLGRFGFGQQRFGQQGSLRLVLNHVHGVTGLTAGERLQGREGSKMFKPSGLLGKSLGCQLPRSREVRIVNGQCPQEHSLDFGE
jgi:hypothetical protein